ncbi:kinase-like protein [Gigaspora margarita]|uniref:Kinase-like protein n=1 Tax=Gigaspora margarita TaxID=4874 RepID=A0A8H4AWJ2_GIGMA|nr:kinase-like protein [Gigaspora margarita]
MMNKKTRIEEKIEERISALKIPLHNYDLFYDFKEIGKSRFGIPVYKSKWKKRNFAVVHKSLKIDTIMDDMTFRRLITENSMNILVHEGKIKIASFGLSKITNAGSSFDQCSLNLDSIAYVEPQFLKMKLQYNLTSKSDIYSLGVVLWEISSGRPPFESFLKKDQKESKELEKLLVNHIIRGNREEPIGDTPPKYIELYSRCWDKDPDNRPETRSVFETLINIYYQSVDEIEHPMHDKWKINKGWTSGNKELDNFIKESQLKANCYDNVIEWIPYDRLKEIKKIGLRPSFGEGTPAPYIKLAKQCMDGDPKKRPSAEEICKNLFNWKGSFDLDDECLNEEELEIKREFLSEAKKLNSKLSSKRIPIQRSKIINSLAITEALKNQAEGIYFSRLMGTVPISPVQIN